MPSVKQLRKQILESARDALLDYFEEHVDTSKFDRCLILFEDAYGSKSYEACTAVYRDMDPAFEDYALMASPYKQSVHAQGVPYAESELTTLNNQFFCNSYSESIVTF